MKKYSQLSYSMKAGFVYLLFLTISISTTFCVRHKPLHFEEGIKQVNGINKGLGLYKKQDYREALKFLNAAWQEKALYNHDLFLYIQKTEQALAKKNN